VSERRLCRLDELADPGSRGLEASDTGLPWDIFLVRSDGAVHGYRNSCPHTGAPLDWTPDQFLDLDHAFIQCAVHGALFRIEDGVCLRGPCLGQALRPVPVQVAEGWVLLDDVGTKPA